MSDYHCPKHGVRWWDYSHNASKPDLRCIKCEIERADLAESQLRQVKADAERIDWADGQWPNGLHIEVCAKPTRPECYEPQAIVFTAANTYRAANVRAAIDAARRNDGTA